MVTSKPEYKIPSWFLNRQKDIKDGKTGQLFSTAVGNKLRDDHRGLRHYWRLRVRTQHTKKKGG